MVVPRRLDWVKKGPLICCLSKSDYCTRKKYCQWCRSTDHTSTVYPYLWRRVENSLEAGPHRLVLLVLFFLWKAYLLLSNSGFEWEEPTPTTQKKARSSVYFYFLIFVPCVSRNEDWIRAIYLPLTWRNVGPGWRTGITNLKNYSTG